MTLEYVLKRIGFAIITLYAAVTADFLLPRLMGGNAADQLASQTALGSAAVAAALKKEFGLENPNLLYQYKQYLIQLFHGNLGISYADYPAPVTDVILKALPWTIGIVLTATILSYAIGWLIGVHGAWKQGKWFDTLTSALSFGFYSVPYFWIGIIVVYALAFYMGWFPMGGAIPANFASLSEGGKLLSILHHGSLPVLSLIIASIAGHLFVLRNNLIRVLSEDYMLLAKAKGLTSRRRKYHYGARNAMLPSVTGLMTSLGTVVGGAITTEIVFSYPGVGMVTFNAILNHDYPVIQGSFLFIAIAVILANLIADLIYPLLDPRVALK